MAIRKVASFRLDTDVLNAYVYGGFAGAAAIESGTESGKAHFTLDGVEFTGTCTEANFNPATPKVADLVFEGVIGNAPYVFAVTVDAANQRIQGLCEPNVLGLNLTADPGLAVYFVTAEAKDLTKSWEYIRVVVV